MAATLVSFYACVSPHVVLSVDSVRDPSVQMHSLSFEGFTLAVNAWHRQLPTPFETKPAVAEQLFGSGAA